MEKKMSYEEAVGELEQIVAKMEDPDVKIGDVKGLVGRAEKLIEFCRNELAGYEKEFSSLLDKQI